MKPFLLLILTFTNSLVWANSSQQERYKSLELLTKVMYMIENQYYQKVDNKKLIEGAVAGMVATLDPHSAYLNEKLLKKVKSDTEGSFGGLGVEVFRKNGAVYIVNTMEGSPAQKAGVRVGDRIVEINKKSVIGKHFGEVINLLKGKVGEKITLGITREGQEGIIRFKLVRKVIKIDPVQGTLLEGSIAYLRLIQFQEGLGKIVERKIKKLMKKVKLSGMILDLRNNPGGLLDEAVNVASLFLPKGIVVTTEARDPGHKDIRYVKKSGFKDTTTPIIVLINGASASASEIVAGALQDYKRALIVGVPSFGKGSVQSVVQIDDKVGLKLTIAEYLTPKKRKIQALGIVPDVHIREIDLEWLNKQWEEKKYLREKDLKNHLKSDLEKTKKKKKKKVQKNALAKRLELDYTVNQALKLLEAREIFIKK